SVHLGSTVESERATSHLHGKGIGGHGRSTTRYTPLPVDTDIDAEIEGSPPPAALHTPGPTARQKTCRDPSSKRDHVKSASKNSAVDGVPGPASGGESGVTAGSTHGSARKTARGGRESVNAGSNQGRNRKSQLRYTRGATFAVRDEARKESVTCAYFAVIGTAFDPFLGLHAAYDLKGSTVSRRAKPDDRVKKDVDWIEQDRRLEVREEEADEILRAHHFDCQFLETIGVFDYSLLVGIHKCKRQVVAQMASGAGSGLGEPSSGEGIGQGEGPLRQYTRIRQGSVAESGAGATEPSSGGSNVELQSLSGVISSSDDPGDRAPAEATVPGSPQRVAAVSAVHRHSLPFGVSLSGRSDSELGVQAQRNGSEDNPPVSVQAHEVSEAGGTTSVLPPSVLLSRGTGLPDNSHIGRRFTCERSQQFSSSPPRTDPSMAPAAPQSVGSLTAKRAKNSRAEKGVDGLMELESRVRDGCAAELQSSSVWSPRGELTVGEEIDADTSWECESAEHGRSPGEGDQQSGRGRMCPARPPTQLQVQGAAVGERGCPKDLTGSHASLTPISDLCWQQKGEYGRHGKDAAADDNKLPQYSSFVRHSGVHGAEHRQRDSGRSSRDILLERRSSSVSCPPSQVSTPRVWLPPRTVQGTAVVSTARHDYLAALSTSSEVLKCLTGGRETAGLRDRCFRSSLFVMASPPTCRTPPSGDAATPVRPVNERSPLQQALVALQNQPPPRCPGPVTQRVFATARGDVATLNQVELSGSSVVGGAGDESGDRLVEGGDNTTKGCMPTHHLSQRSLLGKSNQGGRGASTGRRRGRSEPAGCSPRTESKRTEGERDAILLRSCGQPSSRTPGGGGECTSFTPTPSSGAVSGCDSAGGGRRPGCEGLEALEEAEGQPSGGRKAFQQSIQAGDSLPRNRKPAQTDLDRRLSDASSRLPYANTICSFYNRTLE
ncbi:phosphatidylinositol-4-phosphate 5-kinase, partial [Cystoisospora suis]